MMDERRQAFLDAKAQEETELAAQVGWVGRGWGEGVESRPEGRKCGPCRWSG